MDRRLHRVVLVSFLVSSLIVLSINGRVTAQAGPRCFPETNFCIAGRIREFWEQNGGLPVFGFPISAQIDEAVEGRSVQIQWFERNRLELHPENARPYDVLLGRLGDARLRQKGLDWQSQPHAAGPQAGCLWFEQTQYNVCDQRAGIGFKTYWSRHGLRDAKLTPYQRSLALFGLPLTGPQTETNTSGDTVVTQWFERARLEWHPDEPNDYKVLLGLLGNEVRNNIGLAPSAIPEPTSTSTPTLAPTSKPRPRPRPTSTPRPPPYPPPCLPPYPPPGCG